MLLRMISDDLSMLKDPGFLVIGRKYRIGRSSECSFVVKDLSVSRFHAELHVNQDSVHVKDLDSLNGTFVSGLRIKEAEVKPGHSLTFGNAKFRLASHEITNLPDEEGSAISTFAVKGKAPAIPIVPDYFTESQRRVLQLLLTGLSEKEVAVQLNISYHTVHNHVKEIYRRMGVNSRPALLAKFVEESKFPDKPTK